MLGQSSWETQRQVSFYWVWMYWGTIPYGAMPFSACNAQYTYLLFDSRVYSGSLMNLGVKSVNKSNVPSQVWTIRWDSVRKRIKYSKYLLSQTYLLPLPKCLNPKLVMAQSKSKMFYHLWLKVKRMANRDDEDAQGYAVSCFHMHSHFFSTYWD